MKRRIEKHYTFDLKDKGLGFTVGMILDCKELLPTDVIEDFNRVTREYSGWGNDEPGTYTVPVITVIRKEEETDDEYVLRLKEEEKNKQKQRDVEYMKYLELKAKFEP